MARPPANELSGSVESSLVGASLSLDFPIPQEIPRSPASFRDATPHGLHPEELWRALVLVYDLNREPDQDRLLNKILDAAIEMMGAQRGFIFLRERVRDGRDELKIRAARNFDQESLNNPEAQFSRSIVLDVLNSGQTQVLDSAQSHPLFRTKKSVREQKLRAVICSPLRVDESIDGAIYLDNREADRAFAEPEQMLLSILAAQAGVALTRARHVSLLAEKSAKLEELNAELSKQTERKEEIIVEQRSTIAALDRELAVARDRADIFTRFNQIKGSSESLRAVLNIVDRVADSEQTVLIQGETGTGKELVARALHDNSSRRNNRFVAINCPEIAAELLESELFGHIKGSWTGASSDRDGLFVAAQGRHDFLGRDHRASPRASIEAAASSPRA
jgi:transcriptional regulator with GAF, ATPase, and Fis domain